MAGHSKWANIKHRKERADAKKGKMFSRIAKEIISAVKLGGADPKNNPRLRLAFRRLGQPICPMKYRTQYQKSFQCRSSRLYEMTYELYGHGGVGIIVDVMTDNKNRISLRDAHRHE